METKLRMYSVQPLTYQELENINGGGPWWFWLGETIHKFVILADKIEKANVEYPVSVAEWN